MVEPHLGALEPERAPVEAVGVLAAVRVVGVTRDPAHTLTSVAGPG
jgi:hypothetical protein